MSNRPEIEIWRTFSISDKETTENIAENITPRKEIGYNRANVDVLIFTEVHN